MTDDRLRRWLEAAEQPLAPDPQFAAALHDELRAELGFGDARPAHLESVRLIRTRATRTQRTSRLLLLAAALLVSTIGLAIVVGARHDGKPSALFARIHTGSSVRIAVRPDHPQFTLHGNTTAGFDADVAIALAQQLRLGLQGPVVVAASTIASGASADQWDVALPSVADWRLDASRLLRTHAYYAWPHRLVVLDTSTARLPADLAGEPVCAVVGDTGEDWLRGHYGGARSAPITTNVVTRANDEDCLAALVGGEVAGFVTATLSDADLGVRSGIRVIGGPEAEPRSAVVARPVDGSPDPIDVIDEINAALDVLRDDGTLKGISEKRFGGADVTSR